MRGVLAAVFPRRGVVVVTGPEQHAATVERLANTVRQFLSENEMGSHGELGPTRAALDELVALAGHADEQAQAAIDNYNWGATNLERAEAAEARADELQRERDERPTLEEAMKNVNYWKDKEYEARREADQLRAALEEIAGTDFDEPSDFSELGRIARAALAGVQADNKDKA